jgi:urease accessory protein
MRLFRPAGLLILEALPDAATPAQLQGKLADKLVLTWEERRWLRGRFSTQMGRTIAIALPTGTVVESGQLLYVGDDWYLTMEAAPEPLLLIRTRDRQQAILTAFEVGNLHFPLAIDADCLLVPDDSAMVQLLNRMGLGWERRTAPFQPIGKGQPHGF